MPKLTRIKVTMPAASSGEADHQIRRDVEGLIQRNRGKIGFFSKEGNEWVYYLDFESRTRAMFAARDLKSYGFNIVEASKFIRQNLY